MSAGPLVLLSILAGVLAIIATATVILATSTAKQRLEGLRRRTIRRSHTRRHRPHLVIRRYAIR